MVRHNNIVYCRLYHDVVTLDLDCNVSTTYCWSSSGDEVNWSVELTADHRDANGDA